MIQSIVHLAIYDTASDWEYGAAIAHIAGSHPWNPSPGRYRVESVALTADPVVTMGGLRIVPDLTLDELTPSASAMLVLPGADLWERQPDAMSAFARAARAFLDAGVPVAAICGATAGLAREGLLDDRPHTSNAAEYLGFTGYAGVAHYHAEMAMTAGDLITASGIAPVEFAREVFTRLDLYEPHVVDAWYRFYGRQDVAAFTTLMEAAAAHA